MSNTTQEHNLESSLFSHSGLPLEQAIASYEHAIQRIGTALPNPSLEFVLDVLFIRDRIEALLSADEIDLTAKTLLQIVNLDEQLKKLSQVIASHEQLENCRSNIKPPKTSWWWFLAPQTAVPPKHPSWASQDWIWNGLTVACLVVSTGFVTNTLKAFSQDGLDLLQTFGAIGQGAGLVLVSGGALTDKGKKTVANILTSVNVPPIYQAEVTCACSAAILATTYGINQSLPNLGEYYYNQGQKNYEKGLILEAKEHFKEAINFSPLDYRISTALGNVYETLNLHQEAQSMYQGGFIAGDPESLNGMGRVLLRTAENSEDLLEAETSFRLALATLTKTNLNPELQSEVYSHLGLTLIKQTSMDTLAPETVETILETAAYYLKQGNEIDQTITENRESGLGMGYCYLAEVLEQQGKMQESAKQWELCETRAIPTSIAEYQDILVFGEDKIAERLNVSQILREDLNRGHDR